MSKRNLVVEDQEDLRGVLRDLLTGSGFTVIEAGDGEAGVAKAKSDRPDLILMDIQMPVIEGDEEKARAAGCDHYVTKPYSPMQLLRLIRGFLGDKP
jgi:two-component system cell cycle response regulator DivK